MTPEKKYAKEALLYLLLLERVASGYRQSVLEELRALEKKLLASLSQEFSKGFTYATEQRQQNLIREVRIKIQESYRKLRDDFETFLGSIASHSSDRERKLFLAVFNKRIDTLENETLKTIPGKVLIAGTTLADWWSRQAGDLLFRFTAATRLAARNKSTLPDAIKVIAGTKEASFKDALIEKSKNTAEATVRTGIGATYENTKWETFKINGELVDGLQQISVLDGRTSKLCLAYAWKIWDLNGFPIGHDLEFNGGCPRHFNCRSIIIPIVTGPLKDQPTVEDFLDTLSNKEMNQTMGKGVAELYRAGKITARDLVDSTGRKPIRLKDLTSGNFLVTRQRGSALFRQSQ